MVEVEMEQYVDIANFLDLGYCLQHFDLILM